MKLNLLRKQYVIAAMTAYPVFHTHSYHAGELLRLKDSTQKNNKSTLIHDFSFFMFLIIMA